jgi:peptidoglycan/xylan/chitin deacetylase (PgdA/CDA1 family)
MARVVRRHRMTMVTWDVQGSPGGGQDADELARRVLAKVRPGSIVDFDLGAGSPSAGSTVVVDALPIVLDTLKARGLEAVRLDELLHTAGYVGSCPAGTIR